MTACWTPSAKISGTLQSGSPEVKTCCAESGLLQMLFCTCAAFSGKVLCTEPLMQA